jgi:histidinol-phosphate aminotransferase
MYPFDTRLNAGTVLEIPRLPDFSLDLPSIKRCVTEQKPKIVFVTAPNNPDGRFPTGDEIDALLELPLLVVIDEAYIEFCTDGGRLGEKKTHIKAVPDRDNLIVLRTFSKWAGLAGLRIGYGAFPNWMMPVLWKVKQPYNVNVAASTAAIVSLHDLDTLAANVALLKVERGRLFESLSCIPYLHSYPSQANFILCRVTPPFTATDLKAALMAQGILVRYYQTPLLQDCIRISVGKPEQHDQLLSVLKGLEK